MDTDPVPVKSVFRVRLGSGPSSAGALSVLVFAAGNARSPQPEHRPPVATNPERSALAQAQRSKATLDVLEMELKRAEPLQFPRSEMGSDLGVGLELFHEVGVIAPG